MTPGERYPVAAQARTVAALMPWVMRPRPPWFARVGATTLHTSGQFAVRAVVLLVAAMFALSVAFGLDTLLGAFAAGFLTRLLLGGAAPENSADGLTRDRTVPKPVYFDSGSGSEGHRVSKWSVYDGRTPLISRAAALRAVCSCGWTGSLQHLDWAAPAAGASAKPVMGRLTRASGTGTRTPSPSKPPRSPCRT